MDFVFTVSAENAGTRLDVFLTHHTGYSRSRINKLIKDGCTVINDKPLLKPSYNIEENDVIYLTVKPVKEPEFLPENIPLDFVYHDQYFVVVNKPPGMVVHPGRGRAKGTLASALLYHCNTLSQVGGGKRPGIIHRLDMDTSGLIIAALNDNVHRTLAGMLYNREVARTYVSFVWGHPHPESGTIKTSIGRNPKKPTLQAVVNNGRDAVTHYKTIERYDFLSKLLITLETGRTHQIRVHMAHIGHPVFGDPSYGGREKSLKGFDPSIRMFAKRLLGNLKRQALHAGRLEFKHPVTGKELYFEISPPDDLLILEKALTEM